jgi:hypothetical protein
MVYGGGMVQNIRIKGVTAKIFQRKGLVHPSIALDDCGQGVAIV